MQRKNAAVKERIKSKENTDLPLHWLTDAQQIAYKPEKASAAAKQIVENFNVIREMRRKKWSRDNPDRRRLIVFNPDDE